MKRLLLLALATAVMTGVLLGQKAPQGDEYKGWMKGIQTNVKNFTDAYMQMDVKTARGAAEALIENFTKVEEHWKKQNKTDAVAWAKDAKDKLSEAVEKLKRDDMAYALNLLQLVQAKDCRGCHDQYRPAPPTTKGGN